MERSVLHCDLNNFFASVACLDHPEIAGEPMVVGGSSSDRHGIVLAKNEAAKKLNIQTGEPLSHAKQKYPALAIVPPDFKRYMYYSKVAKEVYSLYTDYVEPFGLDECWVDVSGSKSLFGADELIAKEISGRIKKETGLTLSIGVSFNKVFSKIGSDMKKPDAITVIDSDHYKNIIWPMPTRNIIGIGSATEAKLRALGIYTLGDLAKSSPSALLQKLGKIGVNLWRYANGDDLSPIAKKDFIPPPKSIGRSITCKKDLLSAEEIFKTFLFLAEDVATELRLNRMVAGGICIHLRTNDLETNEIQCVLKKPTRTAYMLAKAGIELFLREYRAEKNLRSVGIRAINLMDESVQYQLNLFDDYVKDINTETLEYNMDMLRGKYGKNIIKRACMMKNESVKVPDLTFKACFNHTIGL